MVPPHHVHFSQRPLTRGVPSGTPDAGTQVKTYQTIFLFYFEKRVWSSAGFPLLCPIVQFGWSALDFTTHPRNWDGKEIRIDVLYLELPISRAFSVILPLSGYDAHRKQLQLKEVNASSVCSFSHLANPTQSVAFGQTTASYSRLRISCLNISETCTKALLGNLSNRQNTGEKNRFCVPRWLRKEHGRGPNAFSTAPSVNCLLELTSDAGTDNTSEHDLRLLQQLPGVSIITGELETDN